MEFVKWKQRKLISQVDLSRKGSIDAPILDLVNFINSLPQYFTTSSCSGRIIVIENVEDSSLKKKGCKWLYVSHDIADSKVIVDSLANLAEEGVIKFEPFVMHIQCHTLADAQLLHQAAVASGLRNSGITVGNKGKTMVAVRSSHGMEVPISSKGQLLVSNEYIDFLVQTANKKMSENLTRIDRFFQNVKLMAEKRLTEPVKKKERIVYTSPLPKMKTGASFDDSLNYSKEDDSLAALEEGLASILFDNT